MDQNRLRYYANEEIFYVTKKIKIEMIKEKVTRRRKFTEFTLKILIHVKHEKKY